MGALLQAEAAFPSPDHFRALRAELEALLQARQRAAAVAAAKRALADAGKLALPLLWLYFGRGV